MSTTALNKAMRRIRAKKRKNSDPTEPIRVWIDKDRTPDGIGNSLTIVFNTDGCRWARAGGCTMCGYVGESRKGSVTGDALLEQLEKAIEHEQEKNMNCENAKLYTSGTFFDRREIPEETRHKILDILSDKRVIVESLPDFIDKEIIEDSVSRVRSLDVAIGLETADDYIRKECVNKYFEFEDFVDATKEAKKGGAGVKTYLLMKPPFLTEKEALEDAVYSIKKSSKYSHTVSINPCNVQKYTLVEELYKKSGYRPPWLWSVQKALKRTKDVSSIVMSDPVGFGSDRGPHNCGECDEDIYEAIKSYSLTGDTSYLNQIECSCKQKWKKVIEKEKSWNIPLN